MPLIIKDQNSLQLQHQKLLKIFFHNDFTMRRINDGNNVDDEEVDSGIKHIDFMNI